MADVDADCPDFVVTKTQKLEWDYFPACRDCWRTVYPTRWPIPFRPEGFGEEGTERNCKLCDNTTESGLKVPIRFASLEKDKT